MSHKLKLQLLLLTSLSDTVGAFYVIINSSTNRYLYGLLGLENWISRHLLDCIRHIDFKRAEKSPVKDRKQTTFICGVNKCLLPVWRRKYLGRENSGTASKFISPMKT